MQSRSIEARSILVVETLSNVAHYADDFDWSRLHANQQVQSDWVHFGIGLPQPARKAFADNCDFGRARAVLRRELASGKQWNSHRAEVIGGCELDYSQRPLVQRQQSLVRRL